MATIVTASKPADYLHIAAWGRVLGSLSWYIANQQEKAFDAGAPLNATHEHYASDGSGPTGEWSTIDDCQNAELRELLESSVAAMRGRRDDVAHQ